MPEITPGNIQYIQLPDDHPVKAFCRQHKITEYSTQEDLMKLINRCNLMFLEELVSNNSQDPPEELIVSEMSKRAEEL